MSIHIITVHLVLGEFERAFEEAERVRESMFRVQIGAHIADFVFLRGWAAGGLASTMAPRTSRRSARKALRESLRALRGWARRGSDFEHMYQLLTAERLRLRGDAMTAVAFYAKGASRAQAHLHRHHAAFAHERRASLLCELGRQTEAHSSLRQAIACYEQWGAEVKVASLQSRLSHG